MTSSPDGSADLRGSAAQGRSPRKSLLPDGLGIWRYLGPAFVASVAYIDPGNFATNIQGGSQFGYRLLWVLLWSNAMAILVQYLSAKLGIVTGRTLPQNCREHFSRPVVWLLWGAAEVAAIATDLAEFLGAALGLDLLIGPALRAHGLSTQAALFAAALVATVAVFGLLALELAGHLWLERAIIGLVAIIGLCYGFEVALVHPDWRQALVATIVPTLDRTSRAATTASLYAAVGMLGATVMPHVVYLHSALVQPRRQALDLANRASALQRFLRLELFDIVLAMNGAWLINSAMILMAAVAFAHSAGSTPGMADAYQTLGPLFGAASAAIFAVALLCSGLSSSTVGVLAGQVIIEGFLSIRFPVFVRRLITILPALAIIAVGLDEFRILVLSQVVLSFALPFALIPLLLLTGREGVMQHFRSGPVLRVLGWLVVGVVLALNLLLLAQLAGWPFATK